MADPKKVKDLAESIAEIGLQEPVSVASRHSVQFPPVDSLEILMVWKTRRSMSWRWKDSIMDSLAVTDMR